MSKRQLAPPLDSLEKDLIETLLAGLNEWRPDLRYPESHSDMQGCVRALLKMYEVKRRPIGLSSLPYHCDTCNDKGKIISFPEQGRRDIIKEEYCPDCKKR